MLGLAPGYLLPAAAILAIVTCVCRILLRRDRGTPEKAMSVFLGEMDGLFSPGSLHWQQEKQRMAMMRENPESGDPPFGPIDLLSGTAVIRQPSTPPSPAEEPTPDRHPSES